MGTATRAPRTVGSESTSKSAKQPSFTDAITEKTGLPSRMVITGLPGIGKSSMAAYAPSPIVVLSPGETGLRTLIDNDLVPLIPTLEIQTWPGLLSLVRELITEKHDYKTVIFDTIDGCEKLANSHVCDIEYKGNWGEKGFMGFYRGYKIVGNRYWGELLATLDKLRTTRRMGIILLAHSSVTTFSNPTGSDYNRYQPAMYRETWEMTYGWANIVLFGYLDIAVEKDKGDRKPTAHMDVEQRLLQTRYHPTADAKNLHNLPAEISMGTSGKEAWQNFTAALAAGRKHKKEA